MRPPEPLGNKIRNLQGPVLVLGASGFIGANLLRMLLNHRKDAFGTSSTLTAWRLDDLPEEHVIATDLLAEHNLEKLLDRVRPRTIFDCVAYGGYSFEQETELIYKTNLIFAVRLLEECRKREITAYIHAGSSSEYGDASAGPKETTTLSPNSHYAVSKAAVSGLVAYAGNKWKFPCANLRLYSVYGPLEDSSRLIPKVIARSREKQLPAFVNPSISRDFVYVDDACEAFVDAALNLREDIYGESFNIGTGVKTTIGEMAALAREVFQIPAEPEFTMPARIWDVPEWYCEPGKARDCLGWTARTSLRDGLLKTAEWYGGLEDPERYNRASKRFGLDERHSVSAVIACYRDAQAVPIMYERLKRVFAKLNIEHEIIFVNDNSPDDSEAIIRELSARDRKVIGICHSRNFGSQAAFRSGMEIATKNACVLLDGDLQDPPELIEPFVQKWKEGYDVVYGRRIKREAPFHMQMAYKLFYRLFDRFSYVPIPHDAGDFSLMDKRVVKSLLRFPERDLFIRGVRAFAGFRQTGVDYVRPARLFGVTTNSLFKNLGWAKKGILSFSNTPLNMLSALGILLLSLSVILVLVQILWKVLYPDAAPKGITTTILLVTFFGAVNLFAVSIIGEYLAKIFEEVKRRPHFIRRHLIRDGEIRAAYDIENDERK